MSNIIQGAEGDQWKTHTTQQLTLSQEMDFNDGRRFRYAKAGAVAVVVAKLYQAPIPVTNHVLQTAAAAAAGARSVALTLGATAATEDQYRDGYLVVDLATNTGFGHLYTIDRHNAVASSGVFTVPLRSAINVAISTAANSVSLIPNNCSGVILAVATTPTATLVGVAAAPFAIGAFGWIQVAGAAKCLGVTPIAATGDYCMHGTTTGAVIAQSTAVSATVPNVGQVIQGVVTASYSTINLTYLE